MKLFGRKAVDRSASLNIKDRLVCRDCGMEIINEKRELIYKCPHCGSSIFEVEWFEHDAKHAKVSRDLKNELVASMVARWAIPQFKSGNANGASRAELEEEVKAVWDKKSRGVDVTGEVPRIVGRCQSKEDWESILALCSAMELDYK